MSLLAIEAQLAQSEQLMWNFVYRKGTSLERWAIPSRSWKTLQQHIAKKAPTNCRNWIGPRGETCGQCRNWLGLVTYSGYPRFRLKLPGSKPRLLGRKTRKLVYPSVQVAVGRIVIAMRDGAIPADRVAGHICPCGEKKLCVNPDHLEAQTPLENFLRIRLNGHSDSALLAMIDSVMEKIRTKGNHMSEREFRLYQVINARLLEVVGGEIIVHNPIEEESTSEPVGADPSEIPF